MHGNANECRRVEASSGSRIVSSFDGSHLERHLPTVKSDSFSSEFCAERLKALSNPLRLRVVDALRQGELTVSDLTELLETEMFTLSHHCRFSSTPCWLSLDSRGASCTTTCLATCCRP